MTKFSERLIMGILSLGYIVGSLCFIIIALGWWMPFHTFETFLLDVNNRWLLGLTAAVILIITFTLFWRSVKTKPIKATVVNETALGQISITLPALEQLILKAAKEVQGVREVKPYLKIVAGGIMVMLKIQVIPDLNIPQVTAELQEIIKAYILKSVGTSVQEIKIQVTKINWDAKVSRVE